MMMFKYSKKKAMRGDTLVEVAIAISVLGVMLAASMAAINHNLIAIMNAAERTAIRSQIDSQAELLRYAWNNNITLTGPGVSTLKGLSFKQALREKHIGYIGSNQNDIKTRSCSAEQGNDRNGGGTFWLAINPTSTDKKTAVSFYGTKGLVSPVADYIGSGTPKAGADGDLTKMGGVWIDAYTPSTSGGAWYVDFYIRACWTPYGSSVSGAGRMQTVVRFRYSGRSDEE